MYFDTKGYNIIIDATYFVHHEYILNDTVVHFEIKIVEPKNLTTSYYGQKRSTIINK